MPHKDPEERRRYWRKWYARNYKSGYKDKLLKRNKKRADENRQRIKEYKESRKCTLCPENHPACLEFHHNDPSKKDKDVSHLITRYSWERVLKEIERCTILCSNCHRKLHYELNGNGKVASVV